MTSIKFANEAEIRAAIADVRNDKTETDYMLTTYVQGSNDTLTLVDSGVGGVAALRQHIVDDNAFYGLVRIIDRIDDSDTVKFVLISFVGERVKPMQKGRISTQKGSVLTFFKPFHCELVTDDISAITHEAAFKLVSSASMSRSNVLSETVKPNYSSPQDALRPRPRTADNKESAATPGVPTISAAPSSNVQAQASQQLKFRDQDQLQAAIADVRNDRTETNWVLAAYVDDKFDTVGLVGTGTGGLEELKSHLQNNNVYYGLVRVTDYVDSHATTKFGMISFIGTAVKPMARARITTHKGAASSILMPFHVEYPTATEVSELEEQQLMKLVGSASGSLSNVKEKN